MQPWAPHFTSLSFDLPPVKGGGPFKVIVRIREVPGTLSLLHIWELFKACWFFNSVRAIFLYSLIKQGYDLGALCN